MPQEAMIENSRNRLEKLGNLGKLVKRLFDKEFTGWIKLNFHRGNLSSKIELGQNEILE